MNSIWTVAVKTESGDDLGTTLFNRQPTETELEEYLRRIAPAEWGDAPDGPGFMGSYLHVEGPYENGVYDLDYDKGPS